MRKHGFTLIELLVVIAIISLLVSILLPSLTKAKELARRIVCASTLRQAGISWSMYFSDNDNILPYGEMYWGALLGNYMDMPGPSWVVGGHNRTAVFEHHKEVGGMLLCPSFDKDANPYNMSYGNNSGFIGGVPSWAFAPPNMPLDKLKSHHILMSDSPYWGFFDGLNAEHFWNIQDFTIYRHSEGMNYLYADSRVEWESGEDSWDSDAARARSWESWWGKAGEFD